MKNEETRKARVRRYGTCRDDCCDERGCLAGGSKWQLAVAELSRTARKEKPNDERWECENGCLATFAIWEICFGVEFSESNYLVWLKPSQPCYSLFSGITTFKKSYISLLQGLTDC